MNTNTQLNTYRYNWSVMLKLVYIGFASMHSFDEFEMRLGDNENQLKDLLNREHGK